MKRYLDDLTPLEYGTGRVTRHDWGTEFSIASGAGGYSNAQLDDYGRSPRRSFPWRPPVCLRLRARANHANPVGTLGFGFWNDPFSFALGQPGAPLKLPSSPQAIWFFYASEHSQIGFAEGVPGHGWKAMSLTTPRVPALLLGPAALAGLILSRISLVRRPVMDLALRQVSAREKGVAAALDSWRDYEIDWRAAAVEFRVDGRRILETDITPAGPLGFVAWIDNQFAIASREDGLLFGVVNPEREQKLMISDLRID